LKFSEKLKEKEIVKLLTSNRAVGGCTPVKWSENGKTDHQDQISEKICWLEPVT
jgi:hypothetical protein